MESLKAFLKALQYLGAIVLAALIIFLIVDTVSSRDDEGSDAVQTASAAPSCVFVQDGIGGYRLESGTGCELVVLPDVFPIRPVCVTHLGWGDLPPAIPIWIEPEDGDRTFAVGRVEPSEDSPFTWFVTGLVEIGPDGSVRCA